MELIIFLVLFCIFSIRFLFEGTMNFCDKFIYAYRYEVWKTLMRHSSDCKQYGIREKEDIKELNELFSKVEGFHGITVNEDNYINNHGYCFADFILNAANGKISHFVLSHDVEINSNGEYFSRPPTEEEIVALFSYVGDQMRKNTGLDKMGERCTENKIILYRKDYEWDGTPAKNKSFNCAGFAISNPASRRGASDKFPKIYV